MAAPVLGNRNAFYVNYTGTDDAGYNAIGAPWSYRTLPAALTALAAVLNPPSATNPWIISIGPGVFDVPAGFQLPPWVWITGSPDGEGGSATILQLTGNITLSSAWAANTTQRGGLANLVIRTAAGSPVIDFTMPVPSAGNPSRTVDVINLRHDMDFTFEATGTADVLQVDSMQQDGTLADTITVLGGTVALNQLRTVADVALASKAAIALAATITASQIPVIGVTKAAAACTVAFDAVSWPLRANVTLTGGPTLTRLSDANGEGYSPAVPGNWSPVPTTVQEALDELAAGGASGTVGLDIEYTGTPVYPLAFGAIALNTLVPVVTSPGRLVYMPMQGVSSGYLNYTENSDTAPINGLITLKFWNLVQAGGAGGTFSIDGCTRMTLLSFPVLVILNCSFGSQNFTVLNTLEMPVLTYIGGNFNPGIMPALVTLNLPELTYIKAAFSPGQPGAMNALTTLTADKLVATGGSFQPQNMATLPTLSFPLLETVGGAFSPSTMAALNAWSFPALKYVGNGFTPGTFGALVSLTMPALIFVGASTGGGNFAPTTMANLTTLTADNLTDINGTFAPTTMASLVTLSFPALARITGAVSTANMAALTTFSLAGMITYGSTISIPSASCANVASVTLGTIGTLKAITGATITLSGLKIPSANVNAILALLVSLDGTGGTTLWGAGKTLTINGGTNGAPTGQGIVDKATLQGRGATITTN